MIVWDGFTLISLIIFGIGLILYILLMILGGIKKTIDAAYTPVLKAEESLGLPLGVKAVINYAIALLIIALLCSFFKI